MQMNAPTSPITFLNPPTLSAVPLTFSHLAVVEPPVRMIYVAGTVGATSAGVVAEGFDAQVALAFDNVTIALAAAGATGKDVVKLTYYIVGWSREKMGVALNGPLTKSLTDENGTHGPPSTLLSVAGLASPKLLFEVDVVAAVKVQVSQMGEKL